jgi:hypothetical protein
MDANQSITRRDGKFLSQERGSAVSLYQRCFGCQCGLAGLDDPRPPAQLVRSLSLWLVIIVF